MSDEESEYILFPPHLYLEVARGIISRFPIKHNLTDAELAPKKGEAPLASAVLAVISITVIYSWLTIESYINYHLHQIWLRRYDGSKRSKRFLDLLGAPKHFEELKKHAKIRRLGERIKTLCFILGCKRPHEVDPNLWQDFKKLSELSRHFLVHPHPGKKHFQENIVRILVETNAGKYVDVAVGILRYLYIQIYGKTPLWLDQNTLIRFEGIDLLPGHTR